MERMDKMDIQTRHFLNEINSIDEPELDAVSIEEERKKLADSLRASSIKSLSITDYTIAGSEYEIPLRIYIPKGKEKFPVHVTMHGGGWVFGTLDSHDHFCRSIAEKAHVIVVSVEYRLAPEHKYPAPFNDCCEAVRWVSKNIHNWNGDPSKLTVGGISAGGNLAAAVALKAKEDNAPKIQAQVLICPVTHYSFDTPSYQKYGDGYFLTKNDMAFFWDHYLENIEDGRQPYASPLLAPDFSDLPSTLLLLAEFDPLYDEGLSYGEKMKQAGVSVMVKNYPTYHGFMKHIDEFEVSDHAVRDISEFLKN